MARTSVVTFHIFPCPTAGNVIVMVTERGQAVGEFTLSPTSMARVRDCLTPGGGFRIQDYPP